MKTLIWLATIFIFSTFIFSATVNAANALAKKLELSQEKTSIQKLMKR